jgi:Ni/Co efflux regulator RcnB
MEIKMKSIVIATILTSALASPAAIAQTATPPMQSSEGLQNINRTIQQELQQSQQSQQSQFNANQITNQLYIERDNQLNSQPSIQGQSPGMTVPGGTRSR